MASFHSEDPAQDNWMGKMEGIYTQLDINQKKGESNLMPSLGTKASLESDGKNELDAGEADVSAQF